MAIVQSKKASGSITVEATSPGLSPASVTVAAKSTTLRPQVAVWERQVPVGPGLTGLWRPIPSAEEGNSLFARFFGAGTLLFTLRQEGNRLTGTVEGAAGFRTGFEPIAIEEGTVEGTKVSFKQGIVTYSGRVTAGRIELKRVIHLTSRMASPPRAPSGPRPAIGPPPDGTDPSRGTSFRRRSDAIVLHRVTS